MSDLLKRKGIVELSLDLIHECPEKVLEVLKDVLIVNLETNNMANTLKYFGYCKYFDIVDEGEKVPQYVCEMTTHSTRWIRQHNGYYSEDRLQTLHMNLSKEIIQELMKLERNKRRMKRGAVR